MSNRIIVVKSTYYIHEFSWRIKFQETNTHGSKGILLMKYHFHFYIVHIMLFSWHCFAEWVRLAWRDALTLVWSHGDTSGKWIVMFNTQILFCFFMLLGYGEDVPRLPFGACWPEWVQHLVARGGVLDDRPWTGGGANTPTRTPLPPQGLFQCDQVGGCYGCTKLEHLLRASWVTLNV